MGTAPCASWGRMAFCLRSALCSQALLRLLLTQRPEKGVIWMVGSKKAHLPLWYRSWLALGTFTELSVRSDGGLGTTIILYMKAVCMAGVRVYCVLAGRELILFVESSLMLCFGFLMKMMAITRMFSVVADWCLCQVKDFLASHAALLVRG